MPPFGSSRGGEEATIEFAIDGLGVRNIVVCGHSMCGAMAALSGEANLDKLPSVKTWIGHALSTKRRLESQKSPCTLHDYVQENVLVQADNLKTHPSVSAALRTQRVQIFGWVYNIESGAVTIYDPTHRKFLPTSELRTEIESNVARFAL